MLVINVSDTKYSMKWAVVYFLCLFVVGQLLVGCNTPTKALNFITPDRIGVGKATGTMAMRGFSDGGYDGNWDNGWGNNGWESGDTWSDMSLTGESESTMVWLEWDFPQWEEPNDYDRYLRDRVRTLNLEKELLIAERELKKRDDVIDKTIDRVDKALDCTPAEREVDGMWPKRLTNTY
tara:strand:- start:2447 stop:2983 length:537 start_codon:yes stop_codon:yes gene_type:complete